MSRPTLSPASRTYIVIPARYSSTRLPHKMLLRETGKSLLEHTYEAACGAQKAAGVLVATDHAEIARDVERFGGDFVMTSPDCASGTDRVAEVARKLPRAEIVVNVQGDEPEISPASIDRVIELLEENPAAGMATVATPIRQPEQLTNPACVKVVFDQSGRALYFSRSQIPFFRDPPADGGRRRSTIRRSGFSTWACTLIGATCCWKWPPCPRRRWNWPKSSNNFACCSRAARFWSASCRTPPAASTRPTTTPPSSRAARRAKSQAAGNANNSAFPTLHTALFFVTMPR